MAEIPNFNPEPDLEALLEEDPRQLDEDSLIEVQRYKAKKLKAKREAGESDSAPGWEMLRPGDYNGSGPSNGTNNENGVASSESGDQIETAESLEDTGEPSREETADQHEDGLQGYYTDLKSETEIEDGETTAVSDTDAPDTASTEPGTSPDHDTPGESSNASAQLLTTITGRIRELENKLDNYHDQTLELKDTIADLREENARLKQRVE